METDLVSWLPPKHPKAVRSEPAAKLREKLLNPSSAATDSSHISKYDEDKDDKHKSSHSKLKEREKDYRERDEKRHSKYEEKDRARKKLRKDDIDPMDPAAYSDIPQVSNKI